MQFPGFVVQHLPAISKGQRGVVMTNEKYRKDKNKHFGSPALVTYKRKEHGNSKNNSKNGFHQSGCPSASRDHEQLRTAGYNYDKKQEKR